MAPDNEAAKNMEASNTHRPEKTHEAPKQNCNTCYGRGAYAVLVGDGYLQTASGKVENKERQVRVCHCCKPILKSNVKITEAVK